ncbi:Endo-1,4-beta-xylanase/feruloyl esterase precursor [Grimontia celer]|uniref:Endo-1,4-beta-xylanase/feruloyl esterase n=1 Tax=Grimontia celer TaxID=1796497 RepID=A0A128F430_9GAMM|nr:alpha/beta hydrolase-fold protein [Grimontia celer]CZF81552.1 Endo-1,4-beta-xylanase/feruloyl esterase precursor [Grimontia celer]
MTVLANENPDVIPAGTLEQFSFDAPSLKGNLAGENANREIIVYLPAGYYADSNKIFPVIYVLHGYEGEPNSWFDEGLNDEAGLDDILDEVINEGDLEPSIVVAVDGRSSLNGSWYINSPISGNFLDYLTMDVVKEIDIRYRTLPGKMAILGHSMGGFGAMLAAMENPTLYRTCVGLSPAGMMMKRHDYQQHAEFFQGELEKLINGGEPEWFIYAYLTIIRAIAPDINNPLLYISKDIDDIVTELEDFQLSDIAMRQVDRIRDLPIYTEIGDNEGESVGEPILDNFNTMIKTFERLDLNVTSHVFIGGHTDKVVEQVYRGLRYIGGVFQESKI